LYECVAIGAPFNDFKCIEVLSIDEEQKFVQLDDTSKRGFIEDSFLWKEVKDNIKKFNSTHNFEFNEPSLGDEFLPVCKSIFAIGTDDESTNKIVWECRKGLRNEVQGLKSLARTNAGEQCRLLINDNAIDPSKERTLTEYSKCGFNTNSNSYCNIQIGDEYFYSVFEGFVDKVISSGIQCHIRTEFCYLWWKLRKSKELIRLINLLMMQQIHYAYVADNDKCVAESVTGLFWQGTFGDGAYNLVLFTPFIFALIIFSLW
jgi:hypothetical protein